MANHSHIFINPMNQCIFKMTSFFIWLQPEYGQTITTCNNCLCPVHLMVLRGPKLTRSLRSPPSFKGASEFILKVSTLHHGLFGQLSLSVKPAHPFLALTVHFKEIWSLRLYRSGSPGLRTAYSH